MEGLPDKDKILSPEPKEKLVLFELIENVLKKKQRQVLRDFTKKNKQFTAWTKANHYSLTQLKTNFTKFLMATGFSTVVVGAAMLGGMPSQAAGAAPTQTSPPTVVQQAQPTTVSPYDQLQEAVKQYQSWPSEQGEAHIGQLVSQLTNVPSTPVLDGYRMNKLMGYFGKEQHLYRYPGDTLEAHFTTEADRAKYMAAGIAPGLGAWGYFAPSKTQFTQEDAQKEKYYIAAQTFLFPGYYSDKNFKNWLKFRKVIVYNPHNGKAVVAVIGDSGPATWTGKSFGGSPAVMDSLQMVDGAGKSQAIVLFVDDPNNQIPLGPINYNPASNTIPQGAI